MSDNQEDIFGDEILATHEEMMQNLANLTPETISGEWPSALTELHEILRHHFTKTKIENPEDEAMKVVYLLSSHFGGTQFYLPKKDVIDRVVRDIKIYNEFTYNNHVELAKKYKTSTTNIYKIIARQEQARYKKVQPSLNLEHA